MINRVLIRIKVIQILYSYLLVEKHFYIESTPSSPTKEKRFAYSLYLDLLLLLIKTAEKIERRKSDRPLADTGFISRLKRDETVRVMLNNFDETSFSFQPVIDELAEKLKGSAIYKNYLKDSGNEIGGGEENLWNDIFNLIVMPDSGLNRLIALRKDYSLRGVERAREMINRTMVNFLASQDNVREIEKSLQSSLDMARELYMRLLYLPVELTDLEERRLDDNRHKFLKSAEDINPNLRFVENRIIAALRDNPELRAYIEKNNISWANEDPLLLRNLLAAIKDSEVYADYMYNAHCDMHDDAEFWRNIYRQVILSNSDFLESLEEKSVFWNDDLEIMSTFMLKSLRRIEEGDNASIVLDKYKDEEDARFGIELIQALHKDKDLILRYIEDVLRGGNWDQERIAFMDMVILETALAEILNFPKIPLKATINEYIELAKSYSSAKSGQFVNGVLGGVVSKLRHDGKLLK